MYPNFFKNKNKFGVESLLLYPKNKSLKIFCNKEIYIISHLMISMYPY